jgi:elongation factor P
MAYKLAGDFRNGDTFEMDSSLQRIVEFQHVKPGKGAAFVRAKLKNVMTGQTLERTFNPSEKFEIAFIEYKGMTYNYQDGDLYYFMDSSTYELVPLEKALVEDTMRFVKEESPVNVSFYKGKAFAIEAENVVNLKIIDCEPGLASATAQPQNKPATLETGYVIGVPAFINNGETIKVDTRTGVYVGRA